VWECILAYERRMLTMILLRGDACVCGSVCLGLYKAPARGDCCKAMDACVGVCVSACTRLMLTVIAACTFMPTCIDMHNCDIANVHMHT
jgi:hypothetical protein